MHLLVGGVGIEPTEPEAPDLQSGPLPSTGYPPIYKAHNPIQAIHALIEGIEPA